MQIEARVVDTESGNTLFTRTFTHTQEADQFAREQENSDTEVKFRLKRY